MPRTRTVQLNVRIRPEVAVAFERALGDLPWNKVFVIERLLEGFAQLDQTQRERLLMRGRADSPDFLDHAWRTIGDPELFELIAVLAQAAATGRMGEVWAAIEAARPGKYRAEDAIPAAAKKLSFSKIEPTGLKQEIAMTLIKIGQRDLDPNSAVALVRAVLR